MLSTTPVLPSHNGTIASRRTKLEGSVWIGLFLDRLDEMAQGVEPFGADGPAGRALLGKRGFTAEREAEARVLVDELERDTGGAAGDSGSTTPDWDALWAWYIEWSAIA
jgi:hypothetical protein